MEKLTNFMESHLVPLSGKINRNLFLSSLTGAFIRITPITVGVALLVIIGNWPYTPWIEWLSAINVKQHFDALIGGTTNVLSLFVVFGFAQIYTEKRNHDGNMAGYIALSSFIILLPQVIMNADANGKPVAALLLDHLGGSGIILAILVGFITAWLFVKLSDRGVEFKLPSTVPPMVSQALKPMFIAMIIFTLFFVVRLICGFTPFGDTITLVQKVIGLPFQSLTANIFSFVLLLTLANVFWFFGVHPNVVYSIMQPMILTVVAGNLAAAKGGQPLPFLVLGIFVGFLLIGGTGGTLGLIIAMFSAKSERYRKMLAIAGVPNIFNINEPLIFGMPIMLNPIFFIPMLIGPSLNFGVSWLLTRLPFFSIEEIAYNPAQALLPWTTPFFLKIFVAGGVKLLIIGCIVLAVNALMWLPFFKVADHHAKREELGEIPMDGV